ncbi:MAG TPA: hypothetical protein DEV81_08470 [Cyanobacteria bacterium UBA11049]|nr:hypothetical protein [Cyanobacteria bacterium UBA11049]
MVGGSQLVSHPGKKIQEFVKEKTIFVINEVRAFVKQQTNKACSVVRVNSGKKSWRGARITKDSKYLERLEAGLKADAIVLISDRQIRLHLFDRIEPAGNAVVIPSTKFSCEPYSNRPSTHRACSIEIQQVALKPEKHDLLKGKFRQLKGGVLTATIKKLHRVRILI